MATLPPSAQILLLANVLVIYSICVNSFSTMDFTFGFVSGPRRYMRIASLLLTLASWKSLPFSWTVRILYVLINNVFIRNFHTYGPEKLFQPGVSASHVSILEVDYNLHKSNSTYITDLDVSRMNVSTHILGRGINRLFFNKQTKVVMDPRNPTRPAKGTINAIPGTVLCSFRREMQPYQTYEIWTRILSWDKKWLYFVTYWVEKGTMAPEFWTKEPTSPKGGQGGKPDDWEKKIYAIAVSKCVCKMGRLTIHPAILIGESGLLPERPGGWGLSDEEMAMPVDSVLSSPNDGDHSAEWDWRRTEAERRKGMQFAKHFSGFDGLSSTFDAGTGGILAKL